MGKGSSASRVVRPRKPEGVTIMGGKGTLRWSQTRLVNSRANPTRSPGKGKGEGYRSQRGYPSKTKTGRKADRVTRVVRPLAGPMAASPEGLLEMWLVPNHKVRSDSTPGR